jgi:type IV pilus assembly protein PilA
MREHGAAAGFTIIELMVVVAIVSILAVIAMPVYLDYVTRSKVSEGLGFVAEAKSTVVEYYHSNDRTMPTDNNTAGLPPAGNYSRYDFIRSLSVGSDPLDGTITINFELPNTEIDNKNLQLVPDTSGNNVVWNCQPAAVDGISSKYVPPNCR